MTVAGRLASCRHPRAGRGSTSGCLRPLLLPAWPHARFSRARWGAIPATGGWPMGRNVMADRERRLSREVQTYIEVLDEEDAREGSRGLSAQEREGQAGARALVEATVDDIIASRETITDNQLAFLENRLQSEPDLLEALLDDRFTRDVIANVSGYVSRTLRLSRLEASRIPSKATNVYVREAMRTYILGLPQASVALSRAALEQALKEILGYQGEQGTRKRMNDLLEEAERAGVVDSVIRGTARELANEGNEVLHEKPTSLAKAYDVLVNAQGSSRACVRRTGSRATHPGRLTCPQARASQRVCNLSARVVSGTASINRQAICQLSLLPRGRGWRRA